MRLFRAKAEETATSAGQDQARPARRVGVSPAVATRAGAVVLWALMAVAVVSGLVGLARPAPRAAAVVAKPPASPVTATGWAELYVAAWLAAGEGQEEPLRAFFPAVPSLIGVRPGGLWAARTAAVAASEDAPGYWSVTVAADVVSVDRAGVWTPMGSRYYLVAVAAAGTGLVATSLPAQVAAPPLARSPRLAYQPAGAAVVRDVQDSVERFITAYVAGDGELDRYITPGAPLRPVRPAPFAKAEVTSLAADGPAVAGKRVRVLAAVRATDPAGRVSMLSYPLALAARDGRWEVAEVLGTPPLAAPPPTGLPAPSSTLERPSAASSTTTPSVARAQPGVTGTPPAAPSSP